MINLISKKTTYEISIIGIKALISKNLNVDEDTLYIRPLYGFPENDDTPGHTDRSVVGFEIIVTE